MIALERTAAGVIVPVRVRAAARRTGIAGEHDGALRIDVTAAPEKGHANQAVASVLSEVLGITKSRVELTSGTTNSRKRFLVTGVELDDIRTRLDAALEAAR